MIPDILKVAYTGNSIITFGEKDDNIVVDSIVDGFNNSIVLDYDIYKQSYYEQAPSYPFSTLAGILKVKSLKNYSQNSLVSSFDYLFNYPVIHLHGKGFLGFKEMQITDFINQTNITKTFNLVELIASLLPSKEIFKYNDNTNKTITKVISYLDINQLSPPPYKRFRVNKTQESITDDFKHNQTSTDWTHDFANGNITKILKEIVPYTANYNPINKRLKIEENITYINSGWNFKPGCHLTVITDKNNRSFIKGIFYEYSNNKLSKERISYSNDTLSMERYYSSYNAYGYPQYVSEKTLGKVKLAKYEYNPISKGRWVTKITDYVGRKTSFEYEPKYGNLTKKTDQGNLITNYTYDAWGRLLTTTTPEGEVVTNRYIWGNNGYSVPPNTLYSKITESNINGKVSVTYDALGREIQTKDETKQILSIVETRYNQKGLVAKKSLPYKLEGMSENSKQWIEYTYDNENRIIGEVSPLLLNNTYQYQSGTHTNSVIKINNISNTTSSQEYNYLGQLEKSTDNGGNITYTYTVTGQPDTITSLNGQTILTYDNAGNRRSITEPNSGTQYSYYNCYGETIKHVDEKGTIKLYEYLPS